VTLQNARPGGKQRLHFWFGGSLSILTPGTTHYNLCGGGKDRP
jgi:hypothetical protein